MTASSESIMYLDPCWFDLLRENDSGKAWITLKCKGQKGIHGYLMYHGKLASKYDIETTDDFRIVRADKSSLEVIKDGITFRFIAPSKVFDSIHNSNIVSLDVSSGGLGVSVGSNRNKCELFVWETANGIVRRDLKGHLADIYCCRLFPSGVVVLSGGADMMLKIWSAETGTNPVTFKGHTAAVTDTAIIDRGKNVISVCKDTYVRLWHCGTGTCVAEIAKTNDVPTCCEIADFEFDETCEASSELEFGVENKLLIVGCENGSIVGVNVGSRSIIFNVKTDYGVHDVEFLPNGGFIVGYQNGSVHLYSISRTGKDYNLVLERVWHDTDSPVESLLALRDGFLVGRRDGSCIWYGNTNRISLVGADVDPIYCMAEDDTFLYTGCRDGKIRKYSIEQMFRN